MRLRRPLCVALGLIAVIAPMLGAPDAHASAANVEVRVLQLINSGRGDNGKAAEVMHAGLRTSARNHSAYQSSVRSLTHDGLAGRIGSASPDPYESNGAPDDGFSSYCENVAYYYPGSAGATEEQVAQKIYSLWLNSTPHRNCMFDSGSNGFNVAGMGMYLDSRGYWWATFDSVRDVTPPTTTGTSSPPPPSGGRSQPPPPPPATSGSGTWTRTEETSSAVQWTGYWMSSSNPYASGGRFRASPQTSAYARYSFVGTAVRWIGIKHPYAGEAEVSIDGAYAATVDQYDASSSGPRVLFQRLGLSSGSHVIEVKARGTKNARSNGYSTIVDAFDRLP